MIGGFLSILGLTLIYSLIIRINSALKGSAHAIHAKDFSLKIIASLMVIFFISGTLLYLHVFYTIGHDKNLAGELGHPVKFSNAEYLFRSMICSLDLFMLDVDTNILDRLDENTKLKGGLAIQSVLSFICTVAILVELVYSRLHAYYKIHYATKITNTKNHLYLFFGYNKPSELLIKDILENDPKAIAVIADEANIKDDATNEWEGIIGLIMHKPKVFKTAKKIGACVVVASQQLNDIDNNATSEVFDALGYIGLSKIKNLIHQLAMTLNPQLHIFFMGEDEELNIRNILALAKDTTIMSIAGDKDLFHRIYCHARYNGPNRVIQDVALKKHLNIKIVDSSHIAIELLKIDPECHPVNVVKASRRKLATVESPLKTLIIGFGEVGRDAFRFLYEFGAFPNSDNPHIRSPFECVIVDKNLDNIKGTFMSSMPAIFQSHDGNESRHPSIWFENADYNSEDFYNKVIYRHRFLEEVNYIIISIGNNDEAISLGVRIFNLIRRSREDVSNLRIFVRCTDDDKVEGIRKIADHYNFGYGKGEKNLPVINIFGQPKKTYTYDLIVSDKLIEIGKLFHKKYLSLRNEGKSWDERHLELTQTDIPNIEKLRKLRRQESQDISNALHGATKIILLKNAMVELSKEKDCSISDWHSFYLRYFNVDESTNVVGNQTLIYYPGLSTQENEIIFHLAQLEHLRWNAAHELMGYVFNADGTNCDERTMKHNCLCSWDQLDKQSNQIKEWSCDYKKYDFCVVDTTIALKLLNR